MSISLHCGIRNPQAAKMIKPDVKLHCSLQLPRI